jgi:hypothetical protein
MPCPSCGFVRGGHHDACPETHPENAADHQAGKSAGRDRQPYLNAATPAYKLGWVQGDAAADEADNSVPWSA